MSGATDQPAAPSPAGGPRWYAWLFTPRPVRAIAALLFALETELRSIVISPRDHGVAHLKLHWWRDEIQRLVQGSPRHPMTQALARLVPLAGIAWNPLTDFVTSLQLELATVAVDDDAELERFLLLADGLSRAMAFALDGGTAGSDRVKIGANLGQTVRGVQIVADWCSMPMDEQRRSAVTRLAARSRAQWQQACQAMTAPGYDALRGLRVLGKLYIVMLECMEREQYQPGHHRLELPAMKSLWTAWLAARQH